MIKIEDLHLSFKDKKVLKGLNLNIPEGSIFGFNSLAEGPATRKSSFEIMMILLIFCILPQKSDHGLVPGNELHHPLEEHFLQCKDMYHADTCSDILLY